MTNKRKTSKDAKEEKLLREHLSWGSEQADPRAADFDFWCKHLQHLLEEPESPKHFLVSTCLVMRISATHGPVPAKALSHSIMAGIEFLVKRGRDTIAEATQDGEASQHHEKTNDRELSSRHDQLMTSEIFRPLWATLKRDIQRYAIDFHSRSGWIFGRCRNTAILMDVCREEGIDLNPCYSDDLAVAKPQRGQEGKALKTLPTHDDQQEDDCGICCDPLINTTERLKAFTASLPCAETIARMPKMSDEGTAILTDVSLHLVFTYCIDHLSWTQTEDDRRKLGSILSDLRPHALNLVQACSSYKELQKQIALDNDAAVCAQPVRTRCGHLFGVHCLIKWIEQLLVEGKTPTCPMCRADLTRDCEPVVDEVIHNRERPEMEMQ